MFEAQVLLSSVETQQYEKSEPTSMGRGNTQSKAKRKLVDANTKALAAVKWAYVSLVMRLN